MVHDPGGKSLYPLQAGMHGAAYLTPDEQHRLWLARVWGRGACYVAILGHNPSAARPDMDDPTIRRDIGFAQRWGFDGLFKINCMTYRATNPKNLLQPNLILTHHDNVDVLRKVGGRCSKVVLAYGAMHPSLHNYADEAVTILREVKNQLWCFGRTKNGDPKHPLYLKNETSLELF